MARRSRKSPLHARELARTMSAPPLPATSGLAASKSATGSSTPLRTGRRCSAPRCDSGITAGRAEAAEIWERSRWPSYEPVVAHEDGMGVPAPLPNQGRTGLQYSGGIKGIVIATVAGSWDEPIGVALPA